MLPTFIEICYTEIKPTPHHISKYEVNVLYASLPITLAPGIPLLEESCLLNGSQTVQMLISPLPRQRRRQRPRCVLLQPLTA